MDLPEPLAPTTATFWPAATELIARSLLVAHAMWEDRALEGPRTERYAGWDGDLGRAILAGERTLADLGELVLDRDLGEETRRLEPVIRVVEAIVPKVEVVAPGRLLVPIGGAVTWMAMRSCRRRR